MPFNFTLIREPWDAAVVVSTHLNAAAPAGGVLSLRPNEAIVLELPVSR